MSTQHAATSAKFGQAVAEWQNAEGYFRNLKVDYEVAYANALLKSVQPSAERRKAEADRETAELRKCLDTAEIDARAREHVVLFMRGADAA
jgi:hypothetical protein